MSIPIEISIAGNVGLNAADLNQNGREIRVRHYESLEAVLNNLPTHDGQHIAIIVIDIGKAIKEVVAQIRSSRTLFGIPRFFAVTAHKTFATMLEDMGCDKVCIQEALASEINAYIASLGGS
jgi:hypothetical protein